MTGPILLILFALFVIFWLISTYNLFATAKTRIDASIQEIAISLKTS